MSTGTSRTPGQVVVGIDGSGHARAAAYWAAAEADAQGQELRILHAADLDRLTRFASFETVESTRETGRVLLVEVAAAVQERFPSLAITKALSRKQPVPALREAAGPQDSIVVGNRGRGGFGALMLGSVGLGVAGGTVPVVVVRGETEWSKTARVTAAVRGATDADWLHRAAHEAQLRGAALQLLGVRNVLGWAADSALLPGSRAQESVRQGEQETQALAAGIRQRFPGLAVTAEVEAGRPVAAVLVEASRHSDLLIIGGRRAEGIGPGVGRIAHALLHHSLCPVEIVPRREAREERGIR
ncbi:universal stress protein [Streptomyces sp. NPDC025273]|uniref:universal stress protein n=1 Tax=unclassified Streptomyces TaxID=2593676 RepID=UPI0033DA90F0